MIVLRDIHKCYGRVRANDGISLTLEPGRIYALVGENGAGKSTLMRILAGHTRPDSGRIEIQGSARSYLTPAKARRLGVGMLYQDPLDFPAMPVWENFRLGGPRRNRAETIRRIDELARNMGARFHPDEPLSALTVGERQLLELMRLLDLGSRTLILDEPTTGITPAQKRNLFNLIKKLTGEKDHTVILVTHKLSEALTMADAIFVMRKGVLKAELKPPYDGDHLIRLIFGDQAGNDRLEVPLSLSPHEQPRLHLHEAVFSGPKYAMPPISLTARPGERIGLVGLEGSGQELFLRGLGGLDRMPQGRYSLDGNELNGNDFIRLRRAGVHFLPAARLELALFPNLNLMEHITLTFPKQKERLKSFYQDQCVRKFNLQAHPDTPAVALSGGNQQRLLLSLIPEEAALLLMEHPTRGLDAGSSRQVWQYLQKRCAQGATLFFFSPDLDEILEQSHRILVFYNRSLAAAIPRTEASVELLGALMAGRQPERNHAH